jgi:hypothetical protein
LGFLRNVGRSINRSAINIGRNITRNPAQAFADVAKLRIAGVAEPAAKEAISGLMPKVEPPPVPTDPTSALRAELSADAKKFREGIGGYKSERVQGLLPSFGIAKEEGVRRTRENFGRRGLLYSGLGQKGEAETRGAVQGEFNRAVAGINQEAEEIATRKEKAAAALGLEQMSMLMGQAEQYYNISAENDIARRRALGNLASGIGYGAGAYFGNQSQGLLGSQQAQPQYAAFAPQPTSYGSLLGVNYGG